MLTMLPNGVFALISSHLNYVDRSSLRSTCSFCSTHTPWTQVDGVSALLHNIIQNVSNNFEFSSGVDEIARGLTTSYICKVYINYAILFQKVRRSSGTFVYIRILTLERNNLNPDEIENMAMMFLSYTPMECPLLSTNKYMQKLLHMVNTSTTS